MANLKEIRGRITSVVSTQQITKAMKMVAAAKLRRAQDRITQMRPYAQQLGNILSNLSATLDSDVAGEFTKERTPEKVMVVAVTADRGLCGAFNTNIIKACLSLADEKYASQAKAGNLHFLNIGSKGFDALRKRGYKVNGDFVDLLQDLNFSKVKEAAEFIIEQYLSGEVDRVELVFNEFKNVVTQIVQVEQFLPLTQAEQESKEESQFSVDYLLEPSKEEIVQELIPKTLKIKLYRAILDSNASEQGARMTSMDNATENANEILKGLRLTYNRSRQAAITTEILEIVAGAEALKSE